MNLVMKQHAAQGYKSGAQIARRITELWGCENLYCISCDGEKIKAEPCNTKARDFVCHECNARYQLKAGRGWSENRVPDAAYQAMIDAIRNDEAPNLLVMQYTPSWTIKNLLLVPSFFFTEAAVEKRKPLSPTARRAGWVGCNILLSRIAPEGKIRLVNAGVVVDPTEARKHFSRLRPFQQIKPKARGWTLDVLRVVRDLEKQVFDLRDIYSHEDELASLYPENRNIQAKIRQQLQVLRDVGIIRFLGKGCYEVLS